MMSLKIDSNSYSINQENISSINKLPVDLILEFFSYLNLATLGIGLRVSKEWKCLLSEPSLWKKAIYQEIAFSNKKWTQCFGQDIVKDEDNKEEFSSLPANIGEILKSPCQAFPGKKIIDTHILVRIPKTINGQPLTLNSLGELAKKYFRSSETGYIDILDEIAWKAIVNQLGDQSIDKSCWVLMTKTILPESTKISYADQQTLVANLTKKALASYEVPPVLKAAVCILSQYFSSKTRLFSDDPWTYTRCQENVQDCQVVIGGFVASRDFDKVFVTSGGLEINLHIPDLSYLGIAALRRL